MSCLYDGYSHDLHLQFYGFPYHLRSRLKYSARTYAFNPSEALTGTFCGELGKSGVVAIDLKQ